uniref:Alpha-conotoxin Lt14.1 n=2 Tax=Conus TaxID=6490 RepID=CLE1_CONLT|nr:RecName: Full=Alpha-conotoxin Lt14.1; AltName: Full=Alpha-L-conotoxin Lt14a; AltName: Full=Alpha-conotoxin LtXIVA; Flags: Precursor [Conus litteratus]ABA39796.1 conotoxin lt14a [Conus litteratus]QFQ61024.1 conotoxin superfamily L [Conus magus]UMA82324.1 conotoxin precursor Cerm03 [Conus ebraeus]UMA83907.1 conotoxin precursor Cerm03 [Conus judaeus]
MKLSVMFIVFLMLTMPMTCAGISRSATNGGEADVRAHDKAANLMALLQERMCPPLCKPSCTNCG